jgi:hypothetical protein
MNMKKKQILLYSTLSFGTFSCTLYTPNATNVPLLQEKGQTSISITGFNNYNLQVAHALGNHIGIIANGFYQKRYDARNRAPFSDNTIGTKKHFGELGIGYFTKVKHNFVYETFVGYGSGKTTIFEETVPANNVGIITHPSRIFIQPSYGYIHNRFEIAFSSRFSKMTFSNPNHVFNENTARILGIQDFYKTRFLFLDPTITVRQGWENLKIQLQFTRSYKLNREPLPYGLVVINFGVIGKFGANSN